MIFQTINSVTSNNLSLKYQRFTLAGCKDMGTIPFELLAKTQFLFREKLLKNLIAPYKTIGHPMSV